MDWGHPLAQGLLAEYLFNEGGGVPHDLALPSRVATPTAGPTWVPSLRGLAMKFVRASAQYLTAPVLNLDHPNLSVSCWINCASFTNYDLPVNRWDDSANNRVWAVAIFGDGTVHWYTSTNGSDAPQIGTSAITTNTWTHLLCVNDSADGSAGKQIYVNGVSAASGGGVSIVTGIPTLLGLGHTTSFAGAAQNFDGQLDHVSIWDRGLSAAEARALYADPYAYLRPVIRRRYFVPQSGAAAAAGVVSRRLPLLGVGS